METPKWRDRSGDVIALFQRRDNKGLQQGVVRGNWTEQSRHISENGGSVPSAMRWREGEWETRGGEWFGERDPVTEAIDSIYRKG